jgi:cytochrome b561/polyisoprenoid-binding protein YceI
MPPRRHASRYSTVAILLHWAIAILLLFEVGLGLRMGAVSGSAKFVVFQLHKSVGITILLLVALRLVWRFYRTPPPIVAKPWERVLAHGVHLLFYGLLLAMPISGWAIVSTSRIVVPTLLYGGVPWPDLPGFATLAGTARTTANAAAALVHVNLVLVIYALFVLHVGGALKHQLLDREGGIARMAPGARPGADWRLIVILTGAVLAAGLGLRWLPLGSPKVAAPVVAAAPAAAASSTPLPTPTPTATPRAMATPAAAAAVAKEPLASWRIAPGSTLGFRTAWSGEPIVGGFTRFDGDIAFSSDDLARSRVAIRIDTASVFSGDAQRDETLKSGDWFAVAAHGTATFKANRFSNLGGDRYLAQGTLALKGMTLPASVRFTLTIAGDKATMRGTASVNRSAYRIGEGDYASTSDIPADVAVIIAVNARRMPR